MTLVQGNLIRIINEKGLVKKGVAERAGMSLATSEHVRFVEDQTVFKGTARYDGKPAIAEAFVVFAINGATATTSMAFAQDKANA